MPTYCFTSESGRKTVERPFPCGKAPSRIRESGVTYWRDIAAEHSEKQPVADAWTKHYSFSMGARTERHEREIGTKCVAAGLDCQFDKHGRLRVNSASHQRKLMKVVLGTDYVNKDSNCG
jgi:hypothetical protein